MLKTLKHVLNFRKNAGQSGLPALSSQCFDTNSSRCSSSIVNRFVRLLVPNCHFLSFLLQCDIYHFSFPSIIFILIAAVFSNLTIFLGRTQSKIAYHVEKVSERSRKFAIKMQTYMMGQSGHPCDNAAFHWSVLPRFKI